VKRAGEGKLPACLKVYRQAASAAIEPESKVADVAVCGVIIIAFPFHGTRVSDQ
jgi:hypothetical protein